jgi:hypothetical protein
MAALRQTGRRCLVRSGVMVHPLAIDLLRFCFKKMKRGARTCDLQLSFPSGLARPAAHETSCYPRPCVVGTEVGVFLVRLSPQLSWTRGSWSTSDYRHGPPIGPGSRILEFLIYGAQRRRRNAEGGLKMELLHRRCCGLDVHKETVVACLRLVSDGKVTTEVRTFQTTTADLLRLSKWLAVNGCTHVAMEATGVYWNR